MLPTRRHAVRIFDRDREIDRRQLVRGYTVPALACLDGDRYSPIALPFTDTGAAITLPDTDGVPFHHLITAQPGDPVPDRITQILLDVTRSEVEDLLCRQLIRHVLRSCPPAAAHYAREVERDRIVSLPAWWRVLSTVWLLESGPVRVELHGRTHRVWVAGGGKYWPWADPVVAERVASAGTDDNPADAHFGSLAAFAEAVLS